MATKYLAKTFKYGVGLQTNWATPLDREDNYTVVAYNSGVTVFEPDVKVELYNTTGQSGIHKEFERVYVDGRSGLPKVNFSMPASLTTIAPHLVGALLTAKATAMEYSDSPYGKTIVAGGLTGTTDFYGNGTYLHTIACDDEASADDGIVLENAIIENLNLSWDFNSNGIARLLQMSGNWIGNEMNFEQTIETGTWTVPTFTPMGNTDLYTLGTFSADGADWSGEDVRQFSFNVANNVTSNASTTAGKANNYDISPVYTSKIILDYNATTELVLKDFQDGATIIAKIDSSTALSNTGDFSISCTGGILQKQPFIYNGEFAGIELDVLWHSTAAATPVTIILSDAVDWGYADNGATP